MASFGCPRCGAELPGEAFEALGELWCPHCGYLGSHGSSIREREESSSGPQQRAEEEAWRKEVIIAKRAA